MGDHYEQDFPAVTGRFVRLNITEASGPPTIWEFHLQPGSRDWECCGVWSRETFREGRAELSLDLSPFIREPGQYEVRFVQTGGGDLFQIAQATLLYEGAQATPGLLTRLAAPNTFNVNRTAQVTAETSSTLQVVITADGGVDCEGTVQIRPRPAE